MTLSETLITYKTRNNLNNTEIARKLQIDRVQVRNILNGSNTTGKVVKKMIDNLGPEFEPFLEYRTCKCGEKFIPKTYNQKCCSDECSWEYIGKGRGKRTVMTLQQRLNHYIEKYCLTGAETARRTGLHVTQISDIRVRNQYSAAMAFKIYQALGDDFKEYFEYSICPFCGKQYVPRNNRQKTCMDDECVKKNKSIMMKEYQRKVNSGEYVMRSYNERRPQRETHRVKSETDCTKYESKARSQGLTYGQLQGLERLGLR